MKARLACEVVATLLLHVIFYKVSLYYLLKYLDILNHSNKFNKNIFFITFLVFIPVKFVNTIFDSNNYKEILSPEFNSHSHIKLIKKYYIKIRKLKNMIYKKNYNYIIADDNTINFKKYLLYNKNNKMKNGSESGRESGRENGRENGIFHRTLFFFLEKKNHCFNYNFDHFREEYKKNEEKNFHKYLNKIYNIFNLLFAGISSMYFLYDYMITFVYYLNLPKVQLQIYNIEERILINFTNYMFKKEEMEKLQSSLQGDLQSGQQGSQKRCHQKGLQNGMEDIFDVQSGPFVYKLKKRSPCGRQEGKSGTKRRVTQQTGRKEQRHKQESENTPSRKKRVDYICTNVLSERNDSQSPPMNGWKKRNSLKKVSAIVSFTNRLRDMCSVRKSNVLNCEKEEQPKVSEFYILSEKYRHSSNTKRNYRRSRSKHFNEYKGKKTNGNFSDHESSLINYFYKNINRNNVDMYKRSNSCPVSLEGMSNISLDGEKAKAAKEKMQLIKYKSLNIIPRRKSTMFKRENKDVCNSARSEKHKTNGRDEKPEEVETEEVEAEEVADESTSGDDTTLLKKSLFKSISFPENKFDKTEKHQKRKQLESLHFFCELENNLHKGVGNDGSDEIDKRSESGQRNARGSEAESELNWRRSIFCSTDDEEVRKIENIKNYNKLKKEIENIVYTNTSMYYSLNAILSQLMGLYFVTNSLLLSSYLPVNYNHIMNFATGKNYDYNIFHLHSDYVFISSFTTSFTICRGTESPS
ncbi:hypothetical protein, conserved [Plasmodium ovale curtisi]|uniref:Abscisic acid G-protein coupled receptor-like domain-containing protein n=1 Tax=Plasmodium ovale curtisi TaxID=864141 RepID=A0A1A8W6L2_PLAOA|nr:hypothetical protein, conserved [Plasmodium ovale curtisi]